MIIFNNKIIISDFSLFSCFSIIFDKIEFKIDFFIVFLFAEKFKAVKFKALI